MSSPATSYFSNVHLELPKQFEEQNKDDQKYYRLLARISCGDLDSDYHFMGKDTLKNFARESSSGVQVKDSHMRKNGFGTTSNGKYNTDEVETISQLTISRGLPLTSDSSYASSDGFVQAIEDKIITMVSVGAYGGDLICQLDGLSMYRSRDCWHWPGIQYEIEVDGAKKKEVCTAEYIGGHLREVSLVDKGACPGADILARLDYFLEKNMIPDTDIVLVKSMYSMPEGTGYSFPSSKASMLSPDEKVKDQDMDDDGFGENSDIPEPEEFDSDWNDASDDSDDGDDWDGDKEDDDGLWDGDDVDDVDDGLWDGDDVDDVDDGLWDGDDSSSDSDDSSDDSSDDDSDNDSSDDVDGDSSDDSVDSSDDDSGDYSDDDSSDDSDDNSKSQGGDNPEDDVFGEEYLAMPTEKQYKERIRKLEKQLEDVQIEFAEVDADYKKAQIKIAELSKAEFELSDQKRELREKILSQYKLNRGANLSGDELTRYEKRINDMDIWNLRQEEQHVEGIAESKRNQEKIDAAERAKEFGDDGDDDDDDLDDDDGDDYDGDDVDDDDSAKRMKKSGAKSGRKSKPATKNKKNKGLKPTDPKADNGFFTGPRV